jgi:hypothetical protein
LNADWFLPIKDIGLRGASQNILTPSINKVIHRFCEGKSPCLNTPLCHWHSALLDLFT